MSSPNVDLKTIVLKTIGLFVVLGAALFVSAGTANWLAGWVFLASFFGFVVGLTLWLFKHNPGLLQERAIGFRSDQKTWDKVLIVVAFVLFSLWVVTMPLDAACFHWSRMPVVLQLAGTALLLCSYYLFFLTFRENSYLSPVVRIQKERGHTVVATGPYHYVRHPMYSAFLFFVLGTTLLLGSWYGLLVGFTLMALVAVRAVLEERALREELAGYDEYMARVKHRLIPGVW
ncbi:MAG: isoprenylcysteine carboxylmethyltransferase family protein [Dehalococcoidia bacterium]|nr:isoprenylcysteine carboxylmethyltransferase family protein [Dehalococcoidia bacterium]